MRTVEENRIRAWSEKSLLGSNGGASAIVRARNTGRNEEKGTRIWSKKNLANQNRGIHVKYTKERFGLKNDILSATGP